MTVIGDAAIVAGIIMDIIQMYKDKGVEVDLDSLEEALQNEKARRAKINTKIKGKVSV